MSLLERAVVPVANEADAAATATALSSYAEEIDHLTVVHVVEKGGGVVDKAPMAKRRADAAAFLSTVESRFGDEEVTVETRIEFGTNVAETVVETALDVGATAVAFRPRGGNRLVRWLSGDTTTRLLTNAELPVVSLRAEGDTAPDSSSPERSSQANDSEASG
jgi:nucleotide-binding universal stress UspA family protein